VANCSGRPSSVTADSKASPANGGRVSEYVDVIGFPRDAAVPNTLAGAVTEVIAPGSGSWSFAGRQHWGV
jgi:hypothetical protein